MNDTSYVSEGNIPGLLPWRPLLVWGVMLEKFVSELDGVVGSIFSFSGLLFLDATEVKGW